MLLCTQPGLQDISESILCSAVAAGGLMVWSFLHPSPSNAPPRALQRRASSPSPTTAGQTRCLTQSRWVKKRKTSAGSV